MGNLKPSANNADSSSSAAAASSSTATAASSGAAVPADQEKINHLMALGFNEQQVDRPSITKKQLLMLFRLDRR